MKNEKRKSRIVQFKKRPGLCGAGPKPECACSRLFENTQLFTDLGEGRDTFVEMLHFLLPPAEDVELPALVANSVLRDLPSIDEASVVDFIASWSEELGAITQAVCITTDGAIRVLDTERVQVVDRGVAGAIVDATEAYDKQRQQQGTVPPSG